ncbi:cupin domain-containing protein [Granulicella tundricola]|uniref:Bicupin, oxalate decarboxylase family n=1 Tax=Granulicella tundricola (strain ATCC BAA-1859 / DSM 23138 / MP5ACTX9) TaxID=1198114 RepID=E8X6Q2_GRATM|nr:cupin domain-containing protein [Granulicella tundricola]ADW71202.1 bicupin, oxalate decarboxylase family [Granulicella tundricola MP5ACTX9]
MSDNQNNPLSRRKFLGNTSAALAAFGALQVASGQEAVPIRSKDHHLINETETQPKNKMLDDQNPSSNWPPTTDAGGQQPFKYSFSLSHKRIEGGGWTRQVTVRDLPISKKMAGVQMRLIKGGIRELHWHVGAEWAFMIGGSARITAVDQQGRAFVDDVNEGDLWVFPGGIPHSIQGLGPDGCVFLLVFDDGNFNEFETFLLTDWLHHTPPEVLAKNFDVPASTFANVPPKELFIFERDLPRPLAEEKHQVEAVTGPVPNTFAFFTSKMAPTKVTKGGSVKIIDAKNFPASNIAAAIVTLKPGGLRELHWHPNEDEWQYYVKGSGRMSVFAAGGRARTMDFQAGDVGYIDKSTPHFVENTGDEDLVFLEVFPTPHYEDISLAEWLAHTPSRLVNEHLGVGEDFLNKISKKEAVVDPE